MIFFSVQIQYVLVSHTKFLNLVITIKNILIQNLNHINKNMKQNNIINTLITYMNFEVL